MKLQDWTLDQSARRSACGWAWRDRLARYLDWHPEAAARVKRVSRVARMTSHAVSELSGQTVTPVAPVGPG